MIIKRVKGDTFNLDIQILNDAGEVIDLTGATVFFTVKRNLQDTDSLALISKTITSHSNPTNGETSITFTSTDVDYIGEFYYDVKIKDVSNKITSVFKDKFILVEHVTIRTS